MIVSAANSGGVFTCQSKALLQPVVAKGTQMYVFYSLHQILLQITIINVFKCEKTLKLNVKGANCVILRLPYWKKVQPLSGY